MTCRTGPNPLGLDARRRYGAHMSDPSASVPGAPPFAPGQVVTVFRSHRRGEVADEYAAKSAEMWRLVHTMPGLVDVKSFVADDGEHVTIATFADEQSQWAWPDQAEHRAAQRAGRDRFYADYSLQVCETVRVRTFTAAERVQR
jgi:heme-degrading monooxygenase HmoA